MSIKLTPKAVVGHEEKTRINTARGAKLSSTDLSLLKL